MQIILWLLYRWELYVIYIVLSQFLYVTFVVLSLLLTFTFKDKNAQFEGYVICTGKSDSQYFKLFKNVLFELVMYFFQNNKPKEASEENKFTR